MPRVILNFKLYKKSFLEKLILKVLWDKKWQNIHSTSLNSSRILKKLPGVGTKTAERFAFQLLELARR